MMAEDKYNGMKLTDVLALGELDLSDVLLNAGISCKTCYKNKSFRGWKEGGIICDEGFVSAPELSVCMKWREGRTESQIIDCTRKKGYSALEEAQ